MGRWFLLVLLCGVLAWGADRLRAGSTKAWTTIAPEVELRNFQSHGGSVVALRTTAEHIRVITGTPREADEWRKLGGALAATNGGFFDAENKPLGLRASKGKRLSPVHGKSWGVFYTRGGQAHIVPTSDFVWKDGIREAVQCGPRLVENGKVLRLKNQWARRTGLGIRRDGRIVLAVADNDMSLPDWAALWADANGFNCVDALNLDGGPSSQLALETKTQSLHLRSGRTVPDAVLIR